MQTTSSEVLTRPADEQVAVVTGASRGIGAAVAVALASAGVKVICVARTDATRPSAVPGTLEDTVGRIRNLGGTAIALPADLADLDQTRGVIQRAVGVFGRLDILVNNAAAALTGGPLSSMRRLEVMLRVNLQAPMLLTQDAVPHMEAAGGGRIVNISSAAAMYSVRDFELYGVSKAALEHLSVATGHHLRARQIAVNCLRIDLQVASEGALAGVSQLPDDAVATDVAAEAVLAILALPLDRSGSVLELSSLNGQGSGMRQKRAEMLGDAPSIYPAS